MLGTVGGRTALHLAARNGLETVVKLLLEKGAPFDACTDLSYNPLHRDIRREEPNCQIVELLLSAGTDIEIETSRGSRPDQRNAYFT
jgi:ankyrin repeat protein